MKKLLSVILTLAIIVGLLSVCAMPIGAAALGTSPSNPIVLTNKKWHTRAWTSSNYDAKCYNKIVVPSNGYIEFVLEKPVDDEGEVCSYELNLYDSKGTVIWEGDKSAENDIFNEYYVYTIGLAAGTYFMDINPSFYVWSDSAPIYTDYRFVFNSSSTWEKESNDNFKTATELTLNKTFSGVIDEDAYDDDYFKINLVKGQDYTVTIGNYSSEAYYDFYDCAQDEKYFYAEGDYGYGKESFKNNNLVWKFTAKQSGYHYIKIEDDPEEDMFYTIKVSTPKISASTCKIKLSTTKYTYNGKNKTPSVTVKNASGKKLKKDVDYTVTYPSSRKKVGKYKVAIKFKGAYTGTKNLYFTINPAKTSVKKVASGKKSLKVTITKKSSQTTGYEVQYSTSKNFKSAKVKKIKSYKTTSLTIKSLKAKKTYYVRVRTYKKVDGKTYYSSWSSAKSKKTK